MFSSSPSFTINHNFKLLCNCAQLYEVYRQMEALGDDNNSGAKNDSISLGVEDILPWMTVEWLLEPLLVESVPNQTN